jgi:type IV secretory pathway VirB2 component (pilin)
MSINVGKDGGVERIVATALVGVISLILFFVPEASAQLETQVTEALNPLARLLVGPVAKGLGLKKLSN